MITSEIERVDGDAKNGHPRAVCGEARVGLAGLGDVVWQAKLLDSKCGLPEREHSAKGEGGGNEKRRDVPGRETRKRGSHVEDECN